MPHVSAREARLLGAPPTTPGRLRSAPDTTKKCWFPSSLPPEIVDMILQHLVVSPKPIDLEIDWKYYISKRKRKPKKGMVLESESEPDAEDDDGDEMDFEYEYWYGASNSEQSSKVYPGAAMFALSRVNKQLNARAMKMFFNKNTFKTNYPENLYKFLDHIGDKGRQDIRNVHFYAGGGVYSWKLRTEAMALLSQCRSLQNLCMEFNRNAVKEHWVDYSTDPHHVGKLSKALFASCGGKSLKKIRGCRNVVVVYKPRSHELVKHGHLWTVFSNAQIQELQDTMSALLCRERDDEEGQAQVAVVEKKAAKSKKRKVARRWRARLRPRRTQG